MKLHVWIAIFDLTPLNFSLDGEDSEFKNRLKIELSQVEKKYNSLWIFQTVMKAVDYYLIREKDGREKVVSLDYMSDVLKLFLN